MSRFKEAANRKLVKQKGLLPGSGGSAGIGSEACCSVGFVIRGGGGGADNLGI